MRQRRYTALNLGRLILSVKADAAEAHVGTSQARLPGMLAQDNQQGA